MVSRTAKMSIQDQVRTFIENPSAAELEPLALAVARFQYHSVPAYRRYWDSTAIPVESVNTIAKIPLVSTAAFKHAEFCCGEPERIFLTSGTSRGKENRGRHLVPKLEIYHASAMAHLKRMLFPDVERISILSLHPRADVMPESSLGQMIQWALEDFGLPDSECVADRERLEVAKAAAYLRDASGESKPVCIMGTTAACATLFEHLRETGMALKLAAGSRLMDTGGAKGQLEPIRAGQLIESASELFGIAGTRVINEYGMTELCSQMYDRTPLNSPGATEGPRLKLAPQWLHVRAVDPADLSRCRRERLDCSLFLIWRTSDRSRRSSLRISDR